MMSSRLLYALAAVLTFLAAPVRAQDACGTFPPGSENYICTCAPGQSDRSVWGSGPFTGDSDICTAARFAGLIGADGGRVTVGTAPGQAGYEGAQANGVTTRDWGSYGESFQFIKAAASTMDACSRYPAGAPSYECNCAPGLASGSVWGSDPYTADSNLCRAAVHAGLIGADGGDIQAVSVVGLQSYAGSDNNGVTSSDWGAFDESITFNRN